MSDDDVTKDNVTKGGGVQPEKASWQSQEPDAADAVASGEGAGEGAGVQPGSSEQTDVDAEPASAGEGLLSLDDLLSGAQSTSCSIDGTCD